MRRERDKNRSDYTDQIFPMKTRLFTKGLNKVSAKPSVN